PSTYRKPAGRAARRFLISGDHLMKDPEADKWFAGKPAEPILRRVREVIMSADPRMSEGTKYGTVMFHFGGDFAGFVQHNQKTVSLMFNRGGIIAGKYPHMEGTGRQVRF